MFEMFLKHSCLHPQQKRRVLNEDVDSPGIGIQFLSSVKIEITFAWFWVSTALVCILSQGFWLAGSWPPGKPIRNKTTALVISCAWRVRFLLVHFLSLLWLVTPFLFRAFLCLVHWKFVHVSSHFIHLCICMNCYAVICHDSFFSFGWTTLNWPSFCNFTPSWTLHVISTWEHGTNTQTWSAFRKSGRCWQMITAGSHFLVEASRSGRSGWVNLHIAEVLFHGNCPDMVIFATF